MCNSRLPSSTPFIDWMALTIKFRLCALVTQTQRPLIAGIRQRRSRLTVQYIQARGCGIKL